MPLPNFLKIARCSIKSAFSIFTFQKLQTKLSSREFVVPLVYSVISMIVFALIYILIGYKNLFVTDEINTFKDKNIENSIIGSIMLQSNAMGAVVPINSLGNWLMTTQTMLSWFFVLAFIYLIV